MKISYGNIASLIIVISYLQYMISLSRTNKIIWILTSFLTIPTSVAGIVVKDLYSEVLPAIIIPGAIAQDIIVLITSVLLLVFTIKLLRANHLVDQINYKIMNNGIMAFYIYAYGIYVIEQVYNWFYLAYLAIFGLSIYSVIFSLIELYRLYDVKKDHSVVLRRSTLFYLLLNPIIFYPLWLSQLIPLLRTADRIENLFSIYIIDLTLIMPAFIILFYLYFHNHKLSYIAVPILFIVGFAILIPLAIGEIIKLLVFDLSLDWGSFWVFVILSFIFFVLTFRHIQNLNDIIETSE